MRTKQAEPGSGEGVQRSDTTHSGLLPCSTGDPTLRDTGKRMPRLQGAPLDRAGLWLGCSPGSETLGQMLGSRPRGQQLKKGPWAEMAWVGTALRRSLGGTGAL